MKTLTTWQPHASLIAAKLKRFETRSWATSYRGLLAIHAAQRWTTQQSDHLFSLAEYPDIWECFSPNGYIETPPLGAVLCICKLVDVLPTESVLPTAMERAVGDWTPGRFAWKLEVVGVFDEPVPARGRQRLWNWQPPADHVASMMELF